ncbi:MAG: hypothetical protein P4M07_23080 [Xanthobacteraceae bacterium]|nr:hypothetical protein [Xanthobacteraceae bacterium]
MTIVTIKGKRGKPKRAVGRLRERASDRGAPTQERLRHAEGAVEIGDDGQGARVYTLRDAPIERMQSRGALEPKEYSALMKFKAHWVQAGLSPSIGSIDLARVFASDPGNYSGMAKTERQVFHRQRYREAVQHIGLRAALVVERVVCAEQTLEMAGFALNWKTPAQARAAATELLRDAGERLAALWGIG